MRRFLFSLPLGVSVWVVTLAPTLLLLVWALAYLVRVAEIAFAPGVPLIYSYTTPDGVARLEVESYSVDPRLRVALVFRARLYDPIGREVASVQRVDARWVGGRLDVRAFGVLGRIERLPDGRLSLERVLPPRRDEPEGDTPFRVRIDRLDARYVDAMGAPLPEERVVAQDVEIVGVGASVLVVAQLEFEGAGRLAASFRSARDGFFEVEATTGGLQAERAAVHVARWLEGEPEPWGREARAESLFVAGTARLTREASDQPWQVGADASFDATGLSVPRYANRASLRGEARAVGDSIHIDATLRDVRRSATFQGVLRAGEPFALAGDVEAQADDRSVLWPDLSELVPLEVEFERLRTSGRLHVLGDRVRYIGSLVAQSASWERDRIAHPDMNIDVTHESLLLRVDRGEWNGASIRGALTVRYGDGALSGFAVTEESDLARLASRFGVDELLGRGHARALLAGTTESPRADVDVSGVAAWQLPDRRVYVGPFDARLTATPERVELARLAAAGPNGVIVAQGTYDARKDQIDIAVRAGAIALSSWAPELTGVGYAFGRVTGTAAEPKFGADVVAFGFGLGEPIAPVLVARGEVDRDALAVRDLRATLNSAVLEGEGRLRFDTGAISGAFQGRDVDLSTFIGQAAVGFVDVHDGRVGGTLERPKYGASVAGRDLVVGGMPVLEAGVRIDGAGDRIEATDAVLTLEAPDGARRGTLHAGGFYVLGEDRGEFAGHVVGVPLEALRTEELKAPTSGLASGEFSFALLGRRPSTLQTRLAMRDVEIGGQPLGDGDATVTLLDGLWEGSALIAGGSKRVEIASARYDEVLDTLDAHGELEGIVLQPILRALNLTEDPTGPVAGLDATVSGAFVASGSATDPTVEVTSLAATDITFRGNALGQLTARGRREGGVWTLESLDWRHDTAVLQAAGTVAESGPLSIDAEVSNFPLMALTGLSPDVPELDGKVDLSLQLGGTTDAPRLDGSLRGSWLPEGSAEPLNVLLSGMSVDAGLLQGSGSFYYEGFAGSIELTAPIVGWPGASESLPDFAAGLRLVERDIATLAYFDAERAKGAFGGFVDVRIVDGSLWVAGEVGTRMATLAVPGVAFELREADVFARFESSRLSLRARGEGSNGGTMSALLTADVDDAVFRAGRRERTLSRVPVRGTIEVEDIYLRENRGREGRLTAIVNAALAIVGTADEPRVSGHLDLSHVDGAAPEVETTGAVRQLPSAPVFDAVALRLESGSTIRTATATVRVGGEGSIDGTPANLDAVARLFVEGGTLRLPTARVTLEPGGTLNLAYRTHPAREAVTTLDVDVVGTTVLTARRFGDIFEQYDVLLEARGDLLTEGGLVLRASSNPPDLSEDAILALLGQKDLIEGLGRGGRGATQTALTRLTLPTLVSPLTENIATALKLDYIGIEYNGVDEQVVILAKTFGRNLTLLARSQVNAPVGGNRKYELKLTYRIPVRDAVLSRTRLGLGFDQDRPWKLSIEYATRL